MANAQTEQDCAGWSTHMVVWEWDGLTPEQQVGRQDALFQKIFGIDLRAQTDADLASIQKKLVPCHASQFVTKFLTAVINRKLVAENKERWLIAVQSIPT